MVLKNVFHIFGAGHAADPVANPVRTAAVIPSVPSTPGSSPVNKKVYSSRAKHAHHTLKSVLAGSIAGATEICFTYPTDYVKIQLQLDRSSATPRFHGIIDCWKQTVAQHGIRGLYRGLNVAILSPKTVVRFGAFEQLKKLSADSKGRLSLQATFFCGLGAGACEAIFAVTPIESVKIKFIHDLNFPTQKYEGLFQGVRRILRKQGIKGIYQGLVPTILKTSSNQAIRFFVVETLKDRKRQGNRKVKVHKGLTAVYGAVGGIVSVFFNTPLDVMKSRMQSLDAKKYRNLVHCAYQIASKEGPLAFYKGMLPRLIRVPMETAITFTMYDIVMELLDDIWET